MPTPTCVGSYDQRRIQKLSVGAWCWPRGRAWWGLGTSSPRKSNTFDSRTWLSCQLIVARNFAQKLFEKKTEKSVDLLHLQTPVGCIPSFPLGPAPPSPPAVISE